MVMKRVGIANLKAHLSGHIRTVKQGETLVIVDRGTPVARIVPTGDLRGGIVIRPATRELAAVRRTLKRLAPRPLPVNSLAILLEDRKR